MRTDIYGQTILNENDLCDLFMRDPTRIITEAYVEQSINFDDAIVLLENIPHLKEYIDPKVSIDEFDEMNQSNWHMPVEYKNMDIAKWVLDQCKTEAELQRAGDELLKFHERGMFILLQYLKYLVDIMRKNNIVWGVGRGSSVASYVYRTAMGKTVDMAALAARNEKTRAVGNMKVNARGDTIDAQGRIIKPVTTKVNEQYANTVGNRSSHIVRRPPQQARPIPPVVSAPVIEEAIELTEAEKELEAEFEGDELTEQIKKIELEQLKKGKK